MFETHPIWCAFTVPPGTPHMVLLAHLEKCVYYTTYWCFLHTHSVVLAHQIWCASTVPPSTPNLVFITHLKYCVQNGPYWSALHTHYGVCCTLDVGVLTGHYSPECASDTAVNTVHTRYLHQIQYGMHS